MSLLAGQPAIEEHFASDVADRAGCPTPHAGLRELAKRVRAKGQEGGCMMERVVGSVVQLDPALNVVVANLDQRDTDHGFEVRQHASQQVVGSVVLPAGDDCMSEEVQSLSSLTIRSRPLGSRISALSLHQLTPGSPLNQVRCRRA